MHVYICMNNVIFHFKYKNLLGKVKRKNTTLEKYCFSYEKSKYWIIFYVMTLKTNSWFVDCFTNYSIASFFIYMVLTLDFVCYSIAAQYIGCFKDDISRDLKLQFTSGNATMQQCQQQCKSSPYFSLQYGVECFCGDSYGRLGRAPENECNMKCSADARQICGGVWRNSVYRKSNAFDVSSLCFYLFYRMDNVCLDIVNSVVYFLGD
jgi:hypothetical protein